MGKLIVNWSTVHGQSGTTSNTVALASMLSLDTIHRSLLTHTQHNFSTLEYLFAPVKNTSFDDTGVEALERLVKSGLLKANNISDYTKTIYKNRLELLLGNFKRNQEEENNSILQSIIQTAKKYYDFIWIDTDSGITQPFSKFLLKEADLVLVNLPQNYYVLNRFFSGTDFPKELHETPYFILISMYDDDSIYSIRNIRRNHKVKVPIFPVKYSTQFKDAANQQDIINFFYRASITNRKNENYTYIKNLREINHEILKLFNMSVLEEEAQ